MSVLLFGVSHRSAPVVVLEQLSIDESDQVKIIDRVLASPLVTEAMVLSTCNRVEVYAVVDAFHGGLSVIGQVLAEHSGMSMGELTKYAYVRYSEAAVEHLFAVASGLDSAVIGEQQVLGQVRRGLLDDRLILPPVCAEQGRRCRRNLIAGRGQQVTCRACRSRVGGPQRGSDLIHMGSCRRQHVRGCDQVRHLPVLPNGPAPAPVTWD